MPARNKPLEQIKATARNATHKANGSPLVITEYHAKIRPALPAKPRGLGPRGRREWQLIWTAGHWLHDDQDYAWVEQIVRSYDDIDTFRKKVNEDGLVVKGSLGQPVAHPLVAEIRKCEQTIRQCLSILGFSPTDRARLGLAEAKAQSALQDLIESAR
jgi:P27 family predicted phage terminase small subunit